MAQCEKCGTRGHDMRDMKANAERTMFVGPCCIKAQPDKLFESTEVEYGVEFSSHMGIKAYVTYGGLTLEYKKTKEEVQKWFETAKQEPQPIPQEQAEEQTQVTLN